MRAIWNRLVVESGQSESLLWLLMDTTMARGKVLMAMRTGVMRSLRRGGAWRKSAAFKTLRGLRVPLGWDEDDQTPNGPALWKETSVEVTRVLSARSADVVALLPELDSQPLRQVAREGSATVRLRSIGIKTE